MSSPIILRSSLSRLFNHSRTGSRPAAVRKKTTVRIASVLINSIVPHKVRFANRCGNSQIRQPPRCPLPRSGNAANKMTVRLTLAQFIPCQSIGCRRLAPVVADGIHPAAPSISTNSYFLASRSGSLVMNDPPEVYPFSRGAKSEPLSCPLPTGLRFFQPPLPANPLASLAARCLCLAERFTGLPRFVSAPF